MAGNKQRTSTAGKKPATKKPAGKKPAAAAATRKPLPIFWIAIGAVLAIAVGAALIAGMGDDKSSSSSGGGSATAGAHEYGTVTVSGTPLPRFPDGGTDPAVGDAIPTVSGEDFSGAPVTITPTAGTPQMIVFLAHWCPHCNLEAPRLASYLQSEGGVPAGVQLTIVPTGSDPSTENWPPSQWVEDMELSGLRTLVDDKKQTAASAFGLSAYPFIVMVDGDGNVVERRSGEQAEGFFAKAFAALAAGEKIPSDA